MNNYAWELLTSPSPELRDPAAALPLAERAVAMPKGRVPAVLDTLALAYRMNGEPDRAVEIQREAVSLLPASRSPARSEIESRLLDFLRDSGEGVSAVEPIMPIFERVVP